MVWVVVPAAGVGKRMNSEVPKQYLEINHQPLICYTLEIMLSIKDVQGVIVALHPEDTVFEKLSIASQVTTVRGGKTRQSSVLAGLQYLSDIATPGDWVLVHDAARPCVTLEAIHRLIETVKKNSVDGGLLALPVRDTVKRTQASKVKATIDRDGLYLAQTPQMFRFGLLKQALKKVDNVTDESSAMEAQGAQICVVEGSPMNIKITYPEDLDMTRYLLRDKTVRA